MKKLCIFAGANGAGKTSFYIQSQSDYGARVNADEIAIGLGGLRKIGLVERL